MDECPIQNIQTIHTTSMKLAAQHPRVFRGVFLQASAWWRSTASPSVLPGAAAPAASPRLRLRPRYRGVGRRLRPGRAWWRSNSPGQAAADRTWIFSEGLVKTFFGEVFGRTLSKKLNHTGRNGGFLVEKALWLEKWQWLDMLGLLGGDMVIISSRDVRSLDDKSFSFLDIRMLWNIWENAPTGQCHRHPQALNERLPSWVSRSSGLEDFFKSNKASAERWPRWQATKPMFSSFVVTFPPA